jgi:hypothetical protein
MKERLSVRVDSERLEKLRRVAKQKRKTMTQLIEDWIDRLQEEKSPAYGRGFKPSFSVKNVFTTCEGRVQHNTASGKLELPCKCLQAGCS